MICVSSRPIFAKTFADAENALQDFEKRYQSAFGNSKDLTASIRKEMDLYRQAVEASNQSEEEKEKILEYVKALPGKEYTVIVNEYYNRKNCPPMPVFIFKE